MDSILIEEQQLSIPFGLEALANYRMLRPFLRQYFVSQSVCTEQLSDADKMESLKSFAREHKITCDQELLQFQLNNILSKDALATWIEIQKRIELYCNRVYLPKAESRFLERKDELDKVVYSLLRLDNEYLANELYLQLIAGEAGFAELAATYAEGPERVTHGMVGPVPLAQAHPGLVKRLRTAKQGVLNEPFQVEHWWILLRVESFLFAKFDDQIASQLSRELFEQEIELKIESTINHIRDYIQKQAKT